MANWRIISANILLATAAVALPLIAIGGNWAPLLEPYPSAALARLQFWFVTVAAQAMFWAAGCGWLLSRWQEISRETSRQDLLWSAIPALIFMVPVAVVTIYMQRHCFPPPRIAGIQIFPIVGIAGAATAAWAMVNTFLAYRSTLVRLVGEHTPMRRIDVLRTGTQMIHQCFFIVAAVLALGIVGTAAQRAAIGATPSREELGLGAEERCMAVKSYTGRQESVIAFGVVGSLLLLAAYAPLRLSLYNISSHEIAAAAGPLPAAVEKVKGWLEERTALTDLLGQDAQGLFGLGGLLSALLPVVLAAVSQLFGG